MDEEKLDLISFEAYEHMQSQYKEEIKMLEEKIISWKRLAIGATTGYAVSLLLIAFG